MEHPIFKFTYNDPDCIKMAMEMPLTGYAPDGDDNGNSVFTKVAALLYLLMKEHDEKAGGEVRDRALEHLRFLTAGGNEPFFDAAPFWNYPVTAASLAVAKATPTVWDALTDDEKARITLLAEGFLILASFATDDRNDYQTGPGMCGNFNKGWNPNYRLANVGQIPFLVHFFGSAEKANAILAGFDVEETMKKAEAFGFTRWTKRWATPGVQLANGTYAPSAKELLSHGGKAYFASALARNGQEAGAPAGEGVGVVGGYLYHGHGLDDCTAIWEDLARFNYNAGPVVSDSSKMRNGLDENGKPKAYILDGTRSPQEGMIGMMTEFASGDAQGVRSSCAYTSHDFDMAVAITAALQTLGIYDINDPAHREVVDLMRVGNADTIYKLEHGYRSFSLGNGYDSHEESYGGYYLWKALWRSTFGAC